MTNDFDPDTVTSLRDEQEVIIRTEAHPDTAVPIWVVVSGTDVFVRSVRGPTGRWYRDLVAGSTATLEVKGQRIPVRAAPATDSDSIARASKEYSAKYRSSPYAASMVRDEVLPTTMRLYRAG